MPVRTLVRGSWTMERVVSREVASTQQVSPALAAEIEALWRAAMVAAPGRVLFDGAMSRLEHFSGRPERFEFEYSTTSYKLFHILHQAHPHLRLGSPAAAAANPLGISVPLLSADGDLLLGRRSSRVAYHPNRVHPFAGGLEPKDGGNLFAAAHRELHEELGLERAELSDGRLLGLVEDTAMGQPEAVVVLQCGLTTAEIRRRLDVVEHDAVIAVGPGALHAFPDAQTPATPVCMGAVKLVAEWLDAGGAGTEWV